MSKKLNLEVFRSNVKVEAIKMYRYELLYNDISKTKEQLIRSACNTLKRRTEKDVFENNEFIFTEDKLDLDFSQYDFSLKLIDEEIVPVLNNKRVYEKYIESYIRKNLSVHKVVVFGKEYRKYSIKDRISTLWFEENNNYVTHKSKDGHINLRRVFNIKVDIKDDGFAYLSIYISSEFESTLTIADLINQGKNIINLRVKNNWSKDKQCGRIKEISEKSVTDMLNFGCSLKDYIENKVSNGKNYVKDISDDTKIIKVEMENNGNILDYYPQALVPIIEMSNLDIYDPFFLKDNNNLIKLNMIKRYKIDQKFIEDIGIINQLNSLSFEKEYVDIEKLKYKPGKVEMPILLCGGQLNNNINCNSKYSEIECNKKIGVFKQGFYKKPDRNIKIGYLYPTGKYELIKSLFSYIYSLCVEGRYHKEQDKYTQKNLLGIDIKAAFIKEYDPNNILEYEQVAREIGENSDGADIVLTIVPDYVDVDDPYDDFKKIWAQSSIPSQMVTCKTAEFIMKEESNSSKFYLHNMILEILGKVGGIPWILKEMKGDVDCFVGLDVGKVETGIHLPACSVMLGEKGDILSCYKTQGVQKGEKINDDILKDIMNNVLLEYKRIHNDYPKNIVIHRDGFSNESNEFYKQCFDKLNINYTIVEIRKNVNMKIAMVDNSIIKNPPVGYCIYNSTEGYVVTTDIDEKKGSPEPIFVKKVYGNLSMPVLLTQIVYLSQLHIGSTKSMRLPITTGYADKICKARDYVPEGKITNKLFFL